MSEQAGTHSVPLGGAAESAERPPELENPRSAAVPFDPVGADYAQRPRRGWKPWAIVGVAIAVPAAVAAALVVTLGGSDTPAAQQAAQTVAAPTPIVETAPTPPTTTAPAAPARTATVAPDRTAATGRVGATTAAPATTAPPATSDSGSAAAEQTATTTVAAQLATPEERLGAWGEFVDITIVEGDSVWALANEYSTTVEAIALVNGLSDPTEISVGDVLAIPVGFAESLTPVEEAAAAEAAAPAGEAANTAVAQFETTPPAGTALADWPNTVDWTIQPGDSLSALATTFETTPEAIMSLNGIEDPNVVYAGTVITIPVGYTGAAESATAPADETPAAPATTTQAAATTDSPADTTTQSATTTEATTTADPASTDNTAGEAASGGDFLEGEAGTSAAADSAAGGDYLEGEGDAPAAEADSATDGDYLES